jgi:transposase
MNEVTLLGIDLAKNVFQLLGLDASGHIVFKKRISSREKLINFIVNCPPLTIAMESCGVQIILLENFQASVIK